MADTIKSLKKEVNGRIESINEILDNHKKAYANLKKALEDHLWEPDAHHPAFLATQLKEARKAKK